jgi:hypothetical protein
VVSDQRSVVSGRQRRQGDMKRSDVTASGLKYAEICPGFMNDPDGDQQYADEGKLLHKACETGDTSKLSQEQRELVERCLKVVEPLVSGAGLDRREHAVNVPIINRRGIIDRLLVRDRTAYAVDWKFGWNPVDDAETNNQGEAYALALLCVMPDVDRVVVLFVSPRCNEISKGEFTRSDMPRLETRIAAIVARRQAVFEGGRTDLLNATDEICRYCGNRGTCSALYTKALVVAQNYSDTALEIPDKFHPSTWTSPEEHSVGRRLALVMEKWAESVKAHNMKFVLEDGQTIPGFELKSKAGRREIRDSVAAFVAVKDEMTAEEFLGACGPVSVSKLEDAVASHAKRGEKTKRKEALNERLTDMGILQSGAETYYLARVRG